MPYLDAMKYKTTIRSSVGMSITGRATQEIKDKIRLATPDTITAHHTTARIFKKINVIASLWLSFGQC
jgi:hypothetical protein